MATRVAEWYRMVIKPDRSVLSGDRQSESQRLREPEWYREREHASITTDVDSVVALGGRHGRPTPLERVFKL